MVVKGFYRAEHFKQNDAANGKKTGVNPTRVSDPRIDRYDSPWRFLRPRRKSNKEVNRVRSIRNDSSCISSHIISGVGLRHQQQGKNKQNRI